MELELLPFSVFPLFATLFLLFFITIIARFRSSSSADTNKNLPPQPWKLPLIGHLHHMIGAPPHRALANLARKLGPIARLQLGEISAILISSPHFAKEIMKTHDLVFADRPKLLSIEIACNYQDIVFAPYGDYWRQMRKICILELLSAKKVRSFQYLREEESRNLVESVAKKKSKTINLTEKIFTMMNTIICKVAVGSECKDQAKYIEAIQEFIYLSGGFDVADVFPSIKILHLLAGTRSKLVKIHKKMDEILDSIISDHRSAGRQNNDNEDLLDVLLRLKDHGGLQFPLTSDQIKAVIFDILAAGTDTSAVTMEWAMSELMKNPRVMKKLQAEIRNLFKGKKEIHESDIQELSYLKLVIMETLRLHPPLPLIVPRECRETCEVGGYHVPIKTKVIINVWKIGRDPDYWNDPENFMPERFSNSSINMMGQDFEYLPFGAGRRMCPGMLLGLADVELPLVTLLYHFNWELPNGANPETLDMTESFGATLKRKNPLLLVPSPYNTN
ncbi:cytochrome P450 71AV8 [Tanacetum coccineum]|uniref:Cytochrome P450 71AV8 n=1 Tax=Tanacetum coccineum TaxID=301880 RepID=A0ABQ5CKJ4_9ASTR